MFHLIFGFFIQQLQGLVKGIISGGNGLPQTLDSGAAWEKNGQSYVYGMSGWVKRDVPKAAMPTVHVDSRKLYEMTKGLKPGVDADGLDRTKAQEKDYKDAFKRLLQSQSLESLAFASWRSGNYERAYSLAQHSSNRRAQAIMEADAGQAEHSGFARPTRVEIAGGILSEDPDKQLQASLCKLDPDNEVMLGRYKIDGKYGPCTYSFLRHYVEKNPEQFPEITPEILKNPALLKEQAGPKVIAMANAPETDGSQNQAPNA